MRTREVAYEDFVAMRDWELKMQEWLGTSHTILRDQSNGTVKPLSLAELEKRKRVRRQPGDDQQISMFEDRFNCMCGV